MSGREQHPAAGGLCLGDTCSGCGDEGRFERGFDPAHLCTDCDEALRLLRSAKPADGATVIQLHPTPARWFQKAWRRPS